ncbi:MAG TPA: aldose 1-epimerase [Bryobacteraceae bacterium]|nr:aldose 1-epimerase [Bryobacteraceae bacterium]
MSETYSTRTVAVDGIDVVELHDAGRSLEARIAPSLGNLAYEISAGGRNILWCPDGGPARLKQDRTFCAIPFLAPWANRIDSEAYWANGRRYLLNPALGNVRRDRIGQPIHGLLNYSPLWKVAAAEADDRSAFVTSRLEFWRHPDLMAQFPFAHNIAMTHRLAEGALEVETAIENLSADPLPVALGYHPYFQLHDAPRDQWHVHLAARQHVVLDERLIPTGARQPVRYADPQPLAGIEFDDVFTDLVRDSDGRARFWFEGHRQRITVSYGPKYTVAVVYAPSGRDYLCFEPMAAVTNAFNLAHAGAYTELQSVPPGGTWRESFWIQPAGF